MRFVSRHAALRVQNLLQEAPARFALIAAAVMAADLVTKEIATRVLGPSGLVEVSDRFSLFLVYNTGSAGGVSVGPYTMQLNVLVTILAVALIAWVVQAMAAVDSRSTRALAFVAGGALGNLASMLWGPQGVADFIAMQLTADTTIVANVADFALWTGAAMLSPVALLLFRLARAERATMVRVNV